MSIGNARPRFFTAIGARAKPTSSVSPSPSLVSFLLADRGHVRPDRARRHKLHDYLPLYPDGGGVYASVRHRSEVISIVGAFLLIADYLVTAAISALSAFQYLGVPHPEKFAAAAILNCRLAQLARTETNRRACVPDFGSDRDRRRRAWTFQSAAHRRSDRTSPTASRHVLAKLGRLRRNRARALRRRSHRQRHRRDEARSRQHRCAALRRQNFHARNFVGHDRSLHFHRVVRTRHARARTDCRSSNGDVNAPGAEGVRDYMLRYMGKMFVGGALGPAFGHIFAVIVSIVFGLLLLSAVNTAIVDLSRSSS